jgi:uncharacterized membrane protein YfcA
LPSCLRPSPPSRDIVTGVPAELSSAQDLLLLIISIGAGLIGALGGVGGGLIIVPVLTLWFGVDVRLAAGASIVSVIATSSGAAVAYLREGWANVRVATFLQLATVGGAIVGALVVADVPTDVLLILLGVVLLLSAASQFFKLAEVPGAVSGEGGGGRLRLSGVYNSIRLGRPVEYAAQRVASGFTLMVVAGLMSGLLGIGSGALKVVAMDTLMRLPLKVSSATSNFMIGVTAAASAGIYIARGYVDVELAAPVVLGVLAGALVGARLLPRLTNRQVRLLFIPVLLVIAAETLLRGLGFGL